MYIKNYFLIFEKVVYLSYFLILILPFIVNIDILLTYTSLHFILFHFILLSLILPYLTLSYLTFSYLTFSYLLHYPIFSFLLNRFGAPPEWVIFNEVVHSKQTMIREISKIDPKWLLEIAGHYFTIK